RGPAADRRSRNWRSPSRGAKAPPPRTGGKRRRPAPGWTRSARHARGSFEEEVPHPHHAVDAAQIMVEGLIMGLALVPPVRASIVTEEQMAPRALRAIDRGAMRHEAPVHGDVARREVERHGLATRDVSVFQDVEVTVPLGEAALRVLPRKDLD